MEREITAAKNAGFCFGVKRATDTLEDTIEHAEKNLRIFTLVHIIHNTIYNTSFSKRA